MDRTLEFYTTLYLQDNILPKVDRAAMMSSLETRTVFLDNDLVEFCIKLPNSWKLKGGRRKHLLKTAMRDLLPPHVLERRKKGFGVPTAKWLRGFPDAPPMRAVGGVRTEQVERLRAEHRERRVDHRLFLWAWLSLQTFQHAALASEGWGEAPPAASMLGAAV